MTLISGARGLLRGRSGTLRIKGTAETPEETDRRQGGPGDKEREAPGVAF